MTATIQAFLVRPILACMLLLCGSALSCQSALFKGRSKSDNHPPAPVCDPATQDCPCNPATQDCPSPCNPEKENCPGKPCDPKKGKCTTDPCDPKTENCPGKPCDPKKGKCTTEPCDPKTENCPGKPCDPKKGKCTTEPCDPKTEECPCDHKDPNQQSSNPACEKPFYTCKKELDGKTDYFPIKGKVYYFGPDRSVGSAPDYSQKVDEDYAGERKFLQKYFSPIITSRTHIAEICMPNFGVYARDFKESFPGLSPDLQKRVNEYFVLHAVTQLVVPKTGAYFFRLNSDDGAILTIDGETVVINDGKHDPQAKDGVIDLTKGKHSLEMRYFQGPRWKIALELFWRADGTDAYTLIPMSNFSPK